MKYNAFIKGGFLRRGLQILPVLALLSCMDAQATVVKTTSVKNSRNLINVTGKVVDQDGNPVPGATVLIKGTKTGTKTDENGVFRLNLSPGNNIIVVTYVGYKVQEVDMTDRTNVTVQLESSGAIDEVVVTGYGSQKRSEVIGSIATVKGEELMDIPAPNIAGALRNRIAGVGVSQVSGRPGASITLNVRNSSTSANAPAGATAEPLYIIDGIIVDRASFDNLDASMIENISILKDASASIYGAAGAKGVMLVTTKRGKEGKPSLTYNGYLGVSDAARTPEMLSAYEHASLLNETNKINNGPAENFFSDEDLEYIKGLNYPSFYDQIWQPALNQRHNIGISGGSDKITFFAGGSYQNENANYPGMKFDKYSFRSGLNATIIEGLKADIAFNVDHSIRSAQHDIGNESDSRFFESLIAAPGWVPLEIDGKLVNLGNDNPLARLQSGYTSLTKGKSYRINTSLTYQPTFLKGFTAKFQVSQGSGARNSRTYMPPFAVYNFVKTGNNNQLFTNELSSQAVNQQDPMFWVVDQGRAQVRPSIFEDNSYQGFLTLQYGNTFGKHSIDLMVGGEQSESNNDLLSVLLTNQLIPNGEDYWAFDVNSLQIPVGGSRRYQMAKRSFFGRLNYDWDKKYLLEAVGRLDASSNFALGNRWGLSPSIGAGWIVSREDFFADNVSFIDFLKLKFNIGIAGDDRVDERLWQERFTIDVVNQYLYGSNVGNSLNPSVIPNPFITWEKKRTINFGVETAMLDNKLTIGAEFFQNKVFDGFDRGTNDITPLYAGIEMPAVNYREAYNWGSEFTIGYRTRIGNEVNLNASMNFSYGNSIVTRVMYPPGDFLEVPIEDGLATRFGTDPRKYNSSNFGLIYQGTFRDQAHVDAFMSENPNYRLYNKVPEPGWMYYEDTNGDGIINEYDLVPMYERTNPLFASGITLGLSYKDFNLSTNINAVIGGKVSYDSRARNPASFSRNVLSIWEDRWTTENPDGWMPRYDDPTLTRNSTFWMTNGTMIRVNNMTLSYRLPGDIASRFGFGGARLLLTGNNLWTLVNPLKYKDPYTSSAYDYPVMRTISVGLSVNL